MLIEISKLPPEGDTYEGEHPATILGTDPLEFVYAADPVKYKLFVQLVSHQIVVEGELSAALSLKCSRCTELFSTLALDSSFLRAYEIRPEQDFLDITEDIREDIILLIPAFPLCSDDCRGLCSSCGKNLNEGPCDCREKEWNDPWNKLNDLEL